MKHDEKQIVSLLKCGDNAAYKYLYDQYYVLLCSIAADYLGDDTRAQMVVADLIFNLWEKRESLHIQSLRNYLIRSVRNRCINYLTLEREKKEISFSSLGMNQEKMIHSSVTFDYPLTTLLENELERQVMQSIENLPRDCRKIFRMSRFENKKYDEIASELGISINTVKYHMKNALTRLYKDLAEYLTLIFLCEIFFR